MLRQSYLVEWSTASFEDYTPTTSTIRVKCSGDGGRATGNFRLELDTTNSTLAAVRVGPILEPMPLQSKLIHCLGLQAIRIRTFSCLSCDGFCRGVVASTRR